MYFALINHIIGYVLFNINHKTVAKLVIYFELYKYFMCFFNIYLPFVYS